MTVINPRIDFAFKKLFGSEENKDILISLINAIVSAEDQVADLQLENPYNQKEHLSDRGSILDIKATDQAGRQYNIEMQITDQVYYNQRALYYWSKLYSSQLQSGNCFSDLKKTISINILNFNYFNSEPDYHNVFKILSVKSHKSYFEDLELHFIELNKFDSDLNHHIKTTLDRWSKFLNRASYFDDKLPEDLSIEPAIEKAFNSLTNLSMNKKEREMYEAQLKWFRDESGAIEKKIFDIARKLLNKGISLELIAETTGLPIHKIQEVHAFYRRLETDIEK